MRKNKQGISLIVLVITIIVMIILAAAIIISLENTGVIGAAENAVCKTNIKQAQNLAVLKWAELYTKGERDTEVIKEKIKEEFTKNKLNPDDYNIEVTTGGVEVSSKAGCVDSSGVEDGSGNSTPAKKWEYAYTYNRAAEEWTAITTNDGTEPTGDIVVRLYNNGPQQIYVEWDDEYVTMDTYSTIISGTGEVNLYEMDDEDVIKLGGEVGNEDNFVSLVHSLTTNLEIREGITSIGKWGFTGEANYDNYNLLKSVKLPNSLITIQKGAFADQHGLEKVEFGTGMQEIGEDAFQDCINLKDITFSEGLVKIGRSAFSSCENIETINIPESVKVIGSGAFKRCKSLKEITIPKNVTKLNEDDNGYPIGAFEDCTALTKVTILGGLTTGSCAFEDCTALKEVILAEGMTLLEPYVFRGCTSLTSIVLPSSLTQINEYAFDDCNALKTIKFAGTQEQWNAISGIAGVPATATVVYNYTGN